MPSVYCFCGYKNNYSSTKPKVCESCGEPLERKPTPKHHQTRKARYQEEEEEIDSFAQEEPEFDAEAIRASIRLHKDGNEGKFMTVEELRKSDASFSRGSAPVENDVREQVIGEMMGTRKPSAEPFIPPSEGPTGVRKVSRLVR